MARRLLRYDTPAACGALMIHEWIATIGITAIFGGIIYAALGKFDVANTYFLLSIACTFASRGNKK